MGDVTTLVTMFCTALTAAAVGIMGEPTIRAERPLGYLERKFAVDLRDPASVAAAKAANLGVRLSAAAAILYIVALRLQWYAG